MKLLYILVVACTVLAAAQAAAVAIGVAVALGLVVTLYRAPCETFAFLITMAALGAFAAAPLPTLGLLALAILANLIREGWQRGAARRLTQARCESLDDHPTYP